MAPSTCCGDGAFLEEIGGLLRVGLEHAIADEAVAHAGDHGDLAQRLAELERGRQHVRARSASPRTISRSRITFAGLKKCVPTTSCGRFVNAAIC